MLITDTKEDLPSAGSRLTVPAGFGLALLVAIASLTGIVSPLIYARESATWAAQGMGQDWVNLLVVAPWLAITASRGSHRAKLLHAGGLVYTAYSFTLYAFAVHFNALFLVYCAILGVSVFALVGLGHALAGHIDASHVIERAPRKSAGALLLGTTVLFALLWLSEIIPALAAGTVPASITEAGLMVNPVHVLDLSLALPAMGVAGVWLLRRNPLGFIWAPIMMTFAVLMTLAIAGMMLNMRSVGIALSWGVPAAIAVITLLHAFLLVRLLRALGVPALPAAAH